ncbi:MAG: tetratricopeptide repeat protein, partial [Patescibacteria group bacterium]
TTHAIVAGWSNDFNGAVENYKKATAYDVAGRYEYRNRFAQYLLDYSVDNEVKTTEIQEIYKYAMQLEEKNVTENPQDYLPELYLSRFNIVLGKLDPKSPYNDIALQHSLKALTYSETFVRTYYEIAQAYLNKKDYVNATAQFEKAIQLNPDVGISYWYLGAVQMQTGQVDEALTNMTTAIKKGYVISENDYLNLANVYVKRNDFVSLVSVYEGLVKVAPANAQYMASLAVAYARVGRIDDAVAAAHRTAEIDVNFLSEARSFVEQLGRTW